VRVCTDSLWHMRMPFHSSSPSNFDLPTYRAWSQQQSTHNLKIALPRLRLSIKTGADRSINGLIPLYVK
jgi:hypothetical protein